MYLTAICNRGLMDDVTSKRNETTSAPHANAGASRTPYRRTVPHLSQAPITDESLSMPPRQSAAGATRTPSGGGRRHMGTATSDPQYLPQNGPAHPRRSQPGDPSQHLHYDRYLQTPTSKKTIFTARQERSRRRTLLAVVLILIVAVVLFVWFVFLR